MTRRVDKVSDVIKEEIASMLVFGEIKDPRIGFVTITKVKMTEDLKQAKVFFSIIGSKEDIERNIEGLRSAIPYIRRTLAKRISMRRIPTVEFVFDDSLEYSTRIEEVIKKLKEEGGMG